MKRIGFIAALLLSLVFNSGCQPPEPVDEGTILRYSQIMQKRSEELSTAAYNIDLRINDSGKKATVMTELYFSGDSVAFYGRAYLGRGAFKGNIIDGYLTVYFMQSNEYYSASLNELESQADCAGPGETLMLLLSVLNGNRTAEQLDNAIIWGKGEIIFRDGRFDHRVKMKKPRRGLPGRDILADPVCSDSMIIKYQWQQNEFPYFQVAEFTYRNPDYEFRARGFVREQMYNINIPEKKFRLDIPLGATRLDSI